MADFMAEFVEAKYHLAVAARMLKGYDEYPDKRFFVGVINESARAVSKLIRAFLIYEEVRQGNLGKFVRKVGPKYLDSVTIGNIVRLLEIEKAHKTSLIEFSKGKKIILLIGGKYRVLTIERLKEFVESVDVGVRVFSGLCRQV